MVEHSNQGDSRHGSGRRKVLKTLGAGGIIGLTGCLGGGSDGEWPPDRNVVDTLIESDPGSLQDMAGRLWMNAAEQYYEEDISTTITPRPGAQGVVMMNELKNQVSRDGGTLGVTRPNNAIINQIGHPDADFDLSEFRTVIRYYNEARGIQVSPRNIDIGGHFDITWEELQDHAEDEGLAFGYPNPAQRLQAEFIRDNDEVLNEDNFDIIEMPSGGDSRAAIQRGDLDLYMGGFVGNITTRNEYYYTGFALVDPERQQDLAEAMYDVEPEEGNEMLGDNKHALITNTAFPDESTQQLIDITVDAMIQVLPPGTSDDIYDIHVDALTQAMEDSDLESQVIEAMDEANWLPLIGEEADQEIQNKVNVMAEDETIKGMIEDMYDF